MKRNQNNAFVGGAKNVRYALIIETAGAVSFKMSERKVGLGWGMRWCEVRRLRLYCSRQGIRNLGVRRSFPRRRQ